MKQKRSRKLKSMLCIVLAIMMVLGTAPVVFADTNAGDDTYNYVSIGASQTNGYGLRGYLDAEAYENPAAYDKNNANVYGYQKAPEGAYPYKISKYLEQTTGKTVELDQLAMSSMRAEEVRVLLDENYDGDAYTRWRFSAGHNWFDRAGGIDKLRDDYKSAISDADLITLEVGVNNFGVYAINQLTSGGKMFDTSLSDVFTPEEMKMYESAKSKISQIVKGEMDYSSTSTVDLIIDTFAYAYMGYITSFDEIIKKINELNPDADIVVLSIPNMLDGVDANVPGVDGTVPLGDIFGGVIKLANLYVETLADNRDVYMYTEAGEGMHVATFLDEILAYSGDPATLSDNMKDCFDLYDDDLKIRTRVQTELAGQEQATIDKALETAYDIVAEIMREGAERNDIDLEALMTGDIEAAENKALTYIEESVMAGVQAVVQGQEYDFQFDESLMNDPDMATVFCMGVRSSIGNSFFAHPSEAGHDQVKAAIVAAIEKGETAKDETDKLITFEYEPSESSYYVALGDGTVQGLNSYAAKFRSEMGLTTSQFKNLGNADVTSMNITDVIDENKATIAKADLITLGFGNGQFVEYMVDNITGNVDTEIDWAKYVGDEYAAKIETTLADLQTSLAAEIGEDTVAMLVDAVEGYGYAYAAFLANYPKAVSKIREINPEAQVVIVGMYNPLKDLTITGTGNNIAVGGYLDYIVNLTDLHYKTYVLSTKSAVYVKAPDVETAESYNETTITGLLKLLRSPQGMYPSKNGHEYIKNQLMAAMKPISHVCSFGDWIVEKEATYTKEGLKYQECTCGERIEEAIPVKVFDSVPATFSTTLSTAKNGYDNVKVSWSKVAGATGYKVFYKKSTSTSWASVSVKGTATSYTTKDLSDGVKYNFRIRPYVTEDEQTLTSTKYKSASIYTLKKISTPKVVKSGTKVKVSWTNINGETGYQISKSTKKTGTSIVSTYKTTTGKYKTISAKKGTRYYYKVRAYKTVGKTKVYGPWSSPKAYKR